MLSVSITTMETDSSGPNVTFVSFLVFLSISWVHSSSVSISIPFSDNSGSFLKLLQLVRPNVIPERNIRRNFPSWNAEQVNFPQKIQLHRYYCMYSEMQLYVVTYINVFLDRYNFSLSCIMLMYSQIQFYVSSYTIVCLHIYSFCIYIQFYMYSQIQFYIFTYTVVYTVR